MKLAALSLLLCLGSCALQVKSGTKWDPVNEKFTLSPGELRRIVELAQNPRAFTIDQLRELDPKALEELLGGRIKVLETESESEGSDKEGDGGGGPGDGFSLEPENACVIEVKPKKFPNFEVEYNFDTGLADAPIFAELRNVEAGLEVEALNADGSVYNYAFSAGDTATIQIVGLYSGSASATVQMFVSGGSGWINLKPYFHTTDVPNLESTAAVSEEESDDPTYVDFHFHRNGTGIHMRFRD